jgi:hypothetical protein
MHVWYGVKQILKDWNFRLTVYQGNIIRAVVLRCYLSDVYEDGMFLFLLSKFFITNKMYFITLYLPFRHF